MISLPPGKKILNRRERGERREKLECKAAKRYKLFKFCVACFDSAVSACSAVKNLKPGKILIISYTRIKANYSRFFSFWLRLCRTVFCLQFTITPFCDQVLFSHLFRSMGSGRRPSARLAWRSLNPLDCSDSPSNTFASEITLPICCKPSRNP